MGWSVARTSSIDEPFAAELMEYGTITGEGKGTQIVVNIISKVEEIIDRFNVTILACEDYMHIMGKEKGIFVVPALIGVLKYHWYLKSSQEVAIVHATKWKSYVCGKGNASKLEVKEHMTQFLGEETILDIEELYKSVNGKGEQDCIDSIAINMFICRLIGNNRNAEDMKIL